MARLPPIPTVAVGLGLAVAGCRSNDRGEWPPPSGGAGPAEEQTRTATAPKPAGVPRPDFEARRAQLVEQLEAQGIEDPRVLGAIDAVPRHELVPERLQNMAYVDRPLPIGEGQTISQPYIVALMTDLADIDDDEQVLEIGTGSGYQAAVLAELAGEVYTIEIVPELATRAKRDLTRLGYADRVRFRQGDGYAGWPEAAPFDAVLVTAAAPKIPEPLIEQLEVGGRLVIPVGAPDSVQELQVFEKTDDGLEQIGRTPVRFVPMTGKAQE